MVKDFEKRFPLAYKYQNTSFDWTNIFNPQAGYDELMDLLNSNSFERDIDNLRSDWERIGSVFYNKIVEGYENELLNESLTKEQRIKIQYALQELQKEKKRREELTKKPLRLNIFALTALFIILLSKNKERKQKKELNG